MADKKTATGNVGVGPSRRKWDAEEFTAKARERDREERERLQENEERMRTGKKPLARRREELPKATELMKAREAPLELDKNLNKTMMVENAGGAGGAGRKGPGFYCELCQRTCKDSVGYLDHINGRTHLRRLGQTTNVARSTVDQVRARIALLRAQTADKTSARSYDFDARLREIAEQEEKERAERRAQRKRDKEAKRAKVAAAAAPATALVGNGGGDQQMDEMAAMGFTTFGSTKGGRR